MEGNERNSRETKREKRGDRIKREITGSKEPESK